MPLRAIASYYPNAVRQALVEQAYHGRIIAFAQTWLGAEGAWALEQIAFGSNRRRFWLISSLGRPPPLVGAGIARRETGVLPNALWVGGRAGRRDLPMLRYSPFT
jgi:hypothetical protein